MVSVVGSNPGLKCLRETSSTASYGVPGLEPRGVGGPVVQRGLNTKRLETLDGSLGLLTS